MACLSHPSGTSCFGIELLECPRGSSIGTFHERAKTALRNCRGAGMLGLSKAAGWCVDR